MAETASRPLVMENNLFGLEARYGRNHASHHGVKHGAGPNFGAIVANERNRADRLKRLMGDIGRAILGFDQLATAHRGVDIAIVAPDLVQFFRNERRLQQGPMVDRKSTRLNSSH